MEERETLVVEVWDTDFEVEERPDAPRYRWVCLYCLTQCGRVRYITDESKTFMCREHANLFRSWRRKRGLPPLKFFRARRGHGIASRAERARARALAILEKEPMTVRQVARHLRWNYERARGCLQRLMEEGRVTRSEEDWPHVWSVARSEGGSVGGGSVGDPVLCSGQCRP